MENRLLKMGVLGHREDPRIQVPGGPGPSKENARTCCPSSMEAAPLTATLTDGKREGFPVSSVRVAAGLASPRHVLSALTGPPCSRPRSPGLLCHQGHAPPPVSVQQTPSPFSFPFRSFPSLSCVRASARASCLRRVLSCLRPHHEATGLFS